MGIVSALLGLAAAAPTPDVSSHAHVSHGGVVLASHASHAPHLGHAIHAPVHAVHHAPALHHAVHPVVHHAPVVAHAIHAAPVIAPVVVKAAPAYAPAPAYHAAPAYKAETYPDEVSPYTFTYAVADDYSKANFNAEETSDGASNVQGGYSVALPDGRIQHVKYVSNGYDGYVADATYEGTAVYPEAKPYAPAPAYHKPAYAPAPAYHA